MQAFTSRPTRTTWLSAVRAGCCALALAGAAGTGAQTPVLVAPDAGAVAATPSASPLPPHWMRGTFMQVHVRAYQDSDGDGHGDLRGLIGRLDYLKALGVTGLWLLPVTESSDRDHGYAVRNYRAIERDYGTLADFDELLAQAHRRGIGVIIDYVINHSSDEHPLFVQSRQSPQGPARDLYLWSAERPEGWSIYGHDPWRSDKTGWYFAAFDGSMPDFNLRNPAALAFHHDNLRYWLHRGVDGFRFDAVGHLVENGPQAWDNQPESRVVVRGLRDLVQGYPHRYTVCEAPGARLAFVDVCGSAFAFELPGRIRGALGGEPAAVRSLGGFLAGLPVNAATFFSNHDAFAGQRLWDQVQGDLARYKLAAASYLLAPGTPFIYYGEEIGMSKARRLSGDPAVRAPMSWTGADGGFSKGAPFREAAANRDTQNVAAEQARTDGILAHYRQLLALRQQSAALSRGRIEGTAAQGAVLVFRRVEGPEQVLVAINYGAQPNQVRVTGLPEGSQPQVLMGAGQPPQPSGPSELLLALPAQSLQVIRLTGAGRP